MTLSSPTCWNFVLASAVACLLSIPLTVAAQQSAPGATPAPLPSPTTSSALQDRPKSEEAQKLAPVVPPPIAKAADQIPIARLKVPDGFKLEIYASGMVNARSLARPR
jgi:glucose/arabinose dehydrogenase